MNCIVEDRDQAHWVIQELGERPDVIGTDLVSPAIDPLVGGQSRSHWMQMECHWRLSRCWVTLR